MGAHVFVDESTRRGYVLVAVYVPSDSLRPARAFVESVRKPGQRRLHARKERPGHRRHLLDGMVRMADDLGVHAVVYCAPRAMKELQQRQACLRALALETRAAGAARLAIEQDDSLIEHDRRTLFSVLRSGDGQPVVPYVHLRAHEDSLLWVADFVVWSWAAGGESRARAAGLVRRFVNVPG